MVESGSKIKEFDTAEEFTKAFDEAVTAGGKFIVYLTGAITECNVSTGLCNSWCPDCDVARPFIDKMLAKNTERSVLKGVVQTKEEWVGVATHPYKVHARIKAGGVPSMVLFDGKNELMRVEDLESFKNEDMLNMLLDN